MQTIDFGHLLDRGVQLGSGFERLDNAYGGWGGVQFRSAGEGFRSVQDVVRLNDFAYLIASCEDGESEQVHRQVVGDSDWLHFQFRVRGGGAETISAEEIFETPDRSCAVARYPQNSVIERRSEDTSEWRVACLYMTPDALTQLLDVSASHLPAQVAWLVEEFGTFRGDTLPLQPAMALAVNDILTCDFHGGHRQAYMRGKALELLTTVIHGLQSAPEKTESIKLSSADIGRLAMARDIMAQDLELNLTLAQLGRRVGLNRTKLALGFKAVYGLSVQAFWRDAKLNHARDLLRDEDARVTEVALSLGYAELSSFTRAFSRKFGVQPKSCRRSRAAH